MAAEQIKIIGVEEVNPHREKGKSGPPLDTFTLPDGEKFTLRRGSTGAKVFRQSLGVPEHKIFLSQIGEIYNANTKDNSKLAGEKLRRKAMMIVDTLSGTLRNNTKWDYKWETVYQNSPEGKPKAVDRAYHLNKQENKQPVKRGRKMVYPKNSGILVNGRLYTPSNPKTRILLEKVTSKEGHTREAWLQELIRQNPGSLLPRNVIEQRTATVNTGLRIIDVEIFVDKEPNGQGEHFIRIRNTSNHFQ
ncbi:MAG: hypothetical protein A3B47_01700 [Candidatus Levybacteria bacterium RIFCSPLOWO2_01_FULL_39_24]|nr:MAG: hypothetical protein A2800_00375 [Candidatus Levybacteria bacterium RIFCSPHIGHO2_01_FULL_40_16]OGH27931.1 MAG: hypothetical protein A3E12_02300 [Candidatus Levybacteria bacterium RIFCSPHIGHO2_12_FULL_39_9]OGH46831.1 MAG: hypothetical protein A3B47_01700 [Candidatus Levybacteria bacterium RIFCSPLOWO2_01_FULL_39_24]